MYTLNADIVAPTDYDPYPAWDEKAVRLRASLSLIRPQIMILDPEISAEWSSDGLNRLNFGGDFWLLNTSYDNRDNGMLSGTSTTTIEFADIGGETKVAVLGENKIFANIIAGLLYGAGTDAETGRDKLLISSSFAIASEDMIPEDPAGGIDHSDDDDTFWYFNAGNPYKGEMGGIIFDLPGFNMDKSEDEDKQKLGIDVSIGAMAYLMTGQNVPTELPPIPDEILEISTSTGSSNGSFAGGGLDSKATRSSPVATTGSGFVFGAHVFASAEVNVIFYASLAIYAGIDLLWVRDEDRLCFLSSGEIVQDPGVNGWYGLGRAYAGLSGKVGIKGKFFGKEFDVKILELTAMMMLEGGGPDPMWLDGRAELSYSILGGAVKGNARMNIEVGDKCVPPRTSPFGFPIIADYYPNETDNEDISNFVKPVVNFTVNINENIYIPGEEDEVHRFRVVFNENNFTINAKNQGAQGTDGGRDSRYDMLSEDGKTATYVVANGLYGKEGVAKKWLMNLTISAEEFNNENYKWETVNVYKDGKYGKWEESLLEDGEPLEFRTKKPDGTLDEEGVMYTAPHRNQKFFLQDDFTPNRKGTIMTVGAEYNAFKPSTESPGFTYEAVFKKQVSGEELYRSEASYDPVSDMLTYLLPESLDNNKKYIVQIVRKTEGMLTIPGNVEARILEQHTTRLGGDEDDEFSDLDISFEATISTDATEINPSDQVSVGEELVYSYTFETSQYNSLEEKLENATITTSMNGNYLELSIDNFEGFDDFDINGYEIDELHAVAPRVKITDQFTGDYQTRVAIPFIGGFASTYVDQVQGTETNNCVDSETLLDIANEHLDGMFSSGNDVLFDETGLEVGWDSNIPDWIDPPYPGWSAPSSVTSYGRKLAEKAIKSLELVPVCTVFPLLPFGDKFDWENAENIEVALNHKVKAPDILQVEDEDDMILTGTNASLYKDNQTRIKYFVIEHIKDDAELYDDFAEEWVPVDGDGRLTLISTNLSFNMSAILNPSGFRSDNDTEIKFEANTTFLPTENGIHLPGSSIIKAFTIE